MEARGFRKADVESCLWIRKDAGKPVTLGLVHVDDFLIFYKDEKWKEDIINHLKEKWEITIEDEENTYLSLRLKKDGNGGFWLDQERYITKAINDLELKGNKTPQTPMKPGQLQKLRTENENKKEPVMEETVLRSHVGKLLWLAICTRPDIAQTVSRLAGTINLRSDGVRDIIFRI